jgi:hypothetical protein
MTTPRAGEGEGVRSIVRRWAVAVAVIASLLASGCEEAGGRTSQWPAGAAGYACQLLEYDRVSAQLGITFDTAGGGKQDETFTCALTKGGDEFPYLTLAVTATTADAVIFTATFVPSGAAGLADLGAIAYQIRREPSGAAGPVTELGWLSTSKRLLVLRYTFAAAATAEDIDGFTPKLVGLAQQIDQTLRGGAQP